MKLYLIYLMCPAMLFFFGIGFVIWGSNPVGGGFMMGYGSCFAICMVNYAIEENNKGN